MFECRSRAAALASAWKRRTNSGEARWLGQDHLHRHGTFEPLLPSLVDHAHAAAADLAQQLIGAEIARHTLGRSRIHDRLAGRRRQHLQGLQTIQRRGQLRVCVEKGFAIGLLAGLEPCQIIVQQVQVRMLQRFVTHQGTGWR